MMLCTKEREVRIVTHTRTGAQACVGRVHMETHARTHTGAHIHDAYVPAPPDVMCVSVHVDRDQRWVLKHFRPLLSPQP